MTNTYIDVRAFCDGEETGHASMASRKIGGLDPKSVGMRAAKYAKLSRSPKRGKPGEYDTIFTPDAVASLLNFVGMMASGFAVIAGYSALGNKLGKRIASDELTLIDDPHAPDSFNPIPFDHEGVPTKRNTIIENGVLRTYLHNRITAKLLNAEHTGNAGWLFPQPWNLCLMPRDSSEEEMVAEMGEGLIVGNVTYVRFQDYVKGDFSGIIRDGVLFVKNGEIRHAIRGLRLSDNILRLLGNIKSIDRETKQVYHWWLEMGIPVFSASILAKKVRYTLAWG